MQKKGLPLIECDSPRILWLGLQPSCYLTGRSDFLAAIFFPFFRFFLAAMGVCLH
jgi:hypothetical protein